MKVSNFIAAFALVSLSCACAQAPRTQEVGQAKYELKVNDEPEKFRFSLVLVSKDNRDICIERLSWPDSKGRTETGSYVYSLRTERGTVFPHAPTIQGDCWGTDCMARIRPGESLKGFIAYSEFGDPTSIRSFRERELHVNIVPSVCERNAGPRE